MYTKLPFFPLQLVVYPNEALNLHIFEPRYRQLIADTNEQNTCFCVPTVIRGKIMPIATEVALSEISMVYPEGESDIKTIGKRVLKLKTFEAQLPQKLYPGGNVEFLEIDLNEDISINEEIVMLIREIYSSMRVKKEVKNAYDGFLTYDIAHYCGLSIDQEYELLTLLTAKDRQQFLLDHLKAISPKTPTTVRSHIKDRAKLNGHFKHLKPPNF